MRVAADRRPPGRGIVRELSALHGQFAEHALAECDQMRLRVPPKASELGRVDLGPPAEGVEQFGGVEARNE
jgi:hypothetical protein